MRLNTNRTGPASEQVFVSREIKEQGGSGLIHSDAMGRYSKSICGDVVLCLRRKGDGLRYSSRRNGTPAS